jgi:hypothetical protein
LLICEKGDENTKATSMLRQVISYYATEISINITIFIVESLSISCCEARTAVKSCYIAVVLNTIKLLCQQLCKVNAKNIYPWNLPSVN